MPQEQVLVYELATGTPYFMHSVDAAEAVRMGDYTYTAPGGKDAAPEDLAVARARAKGMSAPGHPEMMSPEQRERVREEANQVVMPTVAVPMGQPVVLEESHAPVASTPKQELHASGRATRSHQASEDKK